MLKNKRRALAALSVALGLVVLAGPAYAEEQLLPAFFSECWGCSFTAQFMQLGDSIAFRLYDYLGDEIGGLLKALIGVWTLVQAMKLFVPGTDGYDALKSIAKRALLFMCIFLFAGDSQNFKDWIYVPALSYSSQGAVNITGEVKNVTGIPLNKVYNLRDPQQNPGAAEYSYDSIALGSGMENTKELNEVIGNTVGMVGQMQKISGYGIYAGWKMIGSGGWDLSYLARLLIGIVIIIPFGIAFISFPFYVIDLYFRVYILAGIAPLWIAGLGFGPGRSAAITALKGIVSSAATVLMLGVIYTFVGSLMAGTLAYMPDPKPDTFDKFLIAIGEQPERMTIDSSAYWFLLAAGMMTMMGVAKARGVVGALVGGLDDGKSLGDAAGGAVKKLGGLVGTTGAVVTGAVVGKAVLGKMFGGPAAGAASGAASGVMDTADKVMKGVGTFAGHTSSTMGNGNES